MILTKEQLMPITCGALDIVEEDGKFTFRRFTEEQTKYYAIYRNDDYAKKTLGASGVRLAFETDSENFGFECDIVHIPNAGMGYFDIYVDNALTDHFGVDRGEGNFSVKLALGKGVKFVEVYFPWAKLSKMYDITLDDGAMIVPVKRPRVMINYGDSITHGYYAQYPSLSYASRLARMLNAESYNKAIGGDRFFPELLELPEDIVPDIVTVAYGTNDWRCHTRPTLTSRCREFYARLSEKYPEAKIFAISPIWRSVQTSEKFDGPCTDVHTIITEACADLPNVSVINGWNLTAHMQPFYTDGLHPNDLGMSIYAENLYREILRRL